MKMDALEIVLLLVLRFITKFGVVTVPRRLSVKERIPCYNCAHQSWF